MSLHTVTPARTALSVETVAECPFSIAAEYAKEYLQRAEAGGDEALVRVFWLRPLPALAHRVRLAFGIHTDVNEPGRGHEELRFQWNSGTRILPNFRGTLAFRIEGTRTRVLINGSYDVPFGALGRCFDRMIGQRVARISLEDLGARIAAYLTEREQTWRASHTPRRATG